MEKLKKIWDTVSTVLVALVVVLAVFLMGSRLMGYQVFNVVSGSMEPAYSVGDLLYVKEVDPDGIQTGEVITFVLNEDLVVATHRVVDADYENRRFYTKGDANDTPDAAPVHFNNVIGVPVFSIPLLGYVSNYIQNPRALMWPLAAWRCWCWPYFCPTCLRKRRRHNEKEVLSHQSGSDPAGSGHCRRHPGLVHRHR